MTDFQVYERYYLNYCGGDAVFGESHSMQGADPFFVHGPYFITGVTFDFLVLEGTPPAYVCVAFYAAPHPCDISEEAIWSQTLGEGLFGWEPFEESKYDELVGRRVSVSLHETPFLPAGVWYVCLQPVSTDDFGGTPAISFARAGEYPCIERGDAISREAIEDETCCAANGDWGWFKDWHCNGSFEPDTLAIRVEGIAAGDCIGGEQMGARCRPRGGGGGFNIVVKIRDGQSGGAVTAMLDPPDPQSMSIALDGEGCGKGKFKRVSAGEHRVFVCDAIVDVACAP